jgi:uncharacterized membrane protein YfhO
VTRGPSHIRAEVEARTPTTFVVRETWHPRWRAAADGASVAVRRVSPDYMAIDVPEGRHVIDLRFARPPWTWLLWFGPPGLVAAAVAYERRRSASRSTPGSVAERRAA